MVAFLLRQPLMTTPLAMSGMVLASAWLSLAPTAVLAQMLADAGASARQSGAVAPAEAGGRLAAGEPVSTAHASSERAAVGRIVFLTGTAGIVDATGTSRPADSGAVLRAGERIVTGAQSWVHVRMVDDAFIAVRPETTFDIDLYDYDPAAPQDSRIRLQLDRGNARTVSGRGGEAARDRYRFNTPIAAIGLRGTDYTVRAFDGTTRVSVRRGAVAVSPIGGECLADALGPCIGNATRELGAGVPHAYLELSEQHPVPMLIAPEQDPAGAAAQDPVRAPAEPRSDASPDAPQDVAAQSDEIPDAGARRTTAEADESGQAPQAGDETARDHVSGPTPATPETVGEVNVERLLTSAPAPTKLVWGRWSTFAEGRGAPPMVALLDAGREVTYGNTVFGLLRDRAGPVALPTQGVVGFRLDSAEAYVLQGERLAPAEVLAGRFGIDFRQRSFDTGLLIQHSGELEGLHAQGAVQSSGLFASDAQYSNMKVLGALARDASEAAYLFEKSLPGGGGGLLGAVRWLP